MKITYSADSSIREPHYQLILIPGFMIKNKKNKWREFQFTRDNLNKKIVSESLNNSYTTNINGYEYGINVIKHNDILKKKNTKLAFFISGQSTLGYGFRNRNYIYNNGSETNYSQKYAILGFKLSTRLGYDLSDKVYIEYCRPNLMSIYFKYGKFTTDDLRISEKLRKGPEFVIDGINRISFYNNPIKLFKQGFNLAITYKF